MRSPGPAGEAAQKRIDALYTSTLTGRLAQKIKLQVAMKAKQTDSIGKPVELAGKTLEGKDFTTRDYAGKVVLVDFWATWCGPCKAGLPHLKELYGKYHDQGLEIVGISCDTSGEALATFTKDQEMSWVQLWDKTQAKGASEAWHALAREWGVMGIPTMFLIDRDGVLRSVRAREEMDAMVPKLLEEKAKGK
jgi:thiol-disulfide isomerase/thioredoxin